MTEYSREVKQIIDHGSGEDHKRPLYTSPSTINTLSKRPVPESAKWHMRHKPYTDVSIKKGSDTDGYGRETED